MSDLGRRMAFAAEMAREAGAVILPYYQTGVAVERKADRTPVTAADRASETLIRRRIADAYPADAILGEELGEQGGRSGRRWIIDPLDGTKSFIQGVPLFGVLIGLEGPEGPEVGAVYLPALDELVCGARGEGAFWNGRPAHVSEVGELAEACLVYTSVRNFETAGVSPGWRRLCAGSRIQRGWGDCYGYLLVATGRAEAMFDPILNPWDCAPLPPILEEAGGTFTDWSGRRTIHGGSGIATNGRLLPKVLETIGGSPRAGPSEAERT